MSTNSFKNWIKKLSYPVEWCDIDEPIIFGSNIIKNHQPSFWLNRPICVTLEDSFEYGVVLKYIDNEQILVRWDDGEENIFNFREYECMLKMPYIYNKDIIKLMAKELWNILTKTPKNRIQIDYNSFEKEFFYFLYSWS